MVNIQVPLRTLDADVAERIEWMYTNVYVHFLSITCSLVKIASVACEINSHLKTRSLITCMYRI